MSFGLKGKLLGIGVVMTFAPMLLLTGLVSYEFSQITKTAEQGSQKLADQDFLHVAKSVYSLIAAEDDLLRKTLQSFVEMSFQLVEGMGGFGFSKEKVDWTAIDQFSKRPVKIALPKMEVGGKWLGAILDRKSPALLVDRIRDLTGATCTVFQRMNRAGDMLRVSTNVIKKDGRRAIGTYIPAVNPDGRANPVAATLLAGETFRGRAYVVNGWYITAYKPIKDASGEVTGALYVGVPQDIGPTARQAIMDIVIGRTGYAYILDGRGNYVISRQGKRDGESVLALKTPDGVEFVRELIAKAKKLGPGEITDYAYTWQSPDKDKPEHKLVKLAYFAPWDWVIGAGVDQSEIHEEVDRIKTLGGQAVMMILIICGLALVAATVVWLTVARRIANPIGLIISGLTDSSSHLALASKEVAESSGSLAEGSSGQAASLEETSASMEEMAAMTNQNAQNAQAADGLARQAADQIQSANGAMKEMRSAMERINRASDEMAKIVMTIDEIAFQTNLLALNAAVEAARAGEAGAGFAVVADEVRNLALRATESAKSTSELIDGNITNIKTAVNLVAATDQAFVQAAASARNTAKLVEEIAASSLEQQTGIDEVNRAVAGMDQVTQAVASSAEESAASSEELNAQAKSLEGFVADLAALVSGSNGRTRRDKAIGSEPVRSRRTGSTTRPARAHRPGATIPLLDDNQDDF